MSATFRRSSNGTIEARVINDGAPVLVNKTFRISHGMRVEIAHWIDPLAADIWFAMHNACFEMLDNQCSNVFGVIEGDGNYESQVLLYPRPLLMRLQGFNYGNEPFAYLHNSDGRGLGGSNVYSGSGHLCLGDSYNPFTLQPVELFLNNRANNDLEWRGPLLEGEWRDEIFHIESWQPHFNYVQVPPAISAAIARWWPT